MTTQGAIFNYEEVIDLHTEVGRVSVIGLHTPTGDTPRTLCPGFFQQFKRYKYLGCSVSVVPVATLPADPLSVSYEAGEPTMDPRDLANPMMFHGCHGNDLGNILNRLYSAGLVDGNDLTQILRSDSVDLMNMFNGDDDGEPVLQLLENLYYRALTDNTWKKAHIQRGFRKSGLRPRIYSLATNMQIQNATSLGGAYAPGPFQGELDIEPGLEPFAGFRDLTDPEVNPVRYFTPRTVPLGWLDTRQVIPYVPEGNVGDVSLSDLDDTIAGLVRGKTIWNELPKIFMGIILMPPAYKTEQYFRVIINHAFAFKGFRGISMSNDMLEMPPNYENWNEVLSAGDSDPDDPDDPDDGGGGSIGGDFTPPESDWVNLSKNILSNAYDSANLYDGGGYTGLGGISIDLSSTLAPVLDTYNGYLRLSWTDSQNKACSIHWSTNSTDSGMRGDSDAAVRYFKNGSVWQEFQSASALHSAITGLTFVTNSLSADNMLAMFSTDEVYTDVTIQS